MSEEIHPRDRLDAPYLDTQETAFEAAMARGRLHHAWLLTGPPGAGKAAFAYRAARRLLGAKPDPRHGRLGVAADDPVMRLMTAGSHPDFIALEREGEGGALKRNISVEQARRLPEFFSKAPAMGPYRVAIIDAADDLNVNAANAVLKTLEEPSGRGVIFLVSHAPGRLLPTIRSRCRRLVFEGPERVDKITSVDPSLDAVLARLPTLDPAQVQAIGDGMRGAAGAERFAGLIHGLAARARTAALEGGTDGGEGWAGAWTRLSALPEMVEGLNLDRADALFTALQAMRTATIASGRRC